MAKRIKKPPIKPEVRRDWLKRNEEDGESAPQIAGKDGYDVRTVRKQLEQARQEREVREARSAVLRNALESHYDDLRKFAEKLNSEITGARNIQSSPDDDLIESALRQHLPRSPIWGYLSKRQNLQQEIDEHLQMLNRYIEESVRKDSRIIPLTKAGFDGIVRGIVEVLAATVEQWSHGNIDYSLKDSLVMEPTGEGRVVPQLGFSHLGEMGAEHGEIIGKTASDVVRDMETNLKQLEVYLSLERTAQEINRLNGKLREELAVIRLRRIVPGRCKFCPL